MEIKEEFEINHTISNVLHHPYIFGCSAPQQYNFIIKIYKNGNIDIKIQNVNDYGHPTTIYDKLIINDNIPIPIYIIDIFKSLFSNGSQLYEYDMNKFICILQKFKEDFAIIYKKNKLEDNQLKIENQQLKEENVKLNKSYKYFNKSPIPEENEILKKQIEELKRENELLKQNKIISYYC